MNRPAAQTQNRYTFLAMDRKTVKKKLDQLGVPRRRYSLNGKNLDDRVIISKSNNKWYVYYTERGERFNEKYFYDESEACIYFLDSVKRHAGLDID